ncbi:MFS transporter [Acidocella aminolytica]|nr:MFS transporter [Acidocella aminolytica]SHF01622.1 Predicted arabinose efflux permease, MFS family [Acidocella aminolytica 101 = DSM 11237]
MSAKTQPWDTAYEVKAVILLSLAFGLVGLDRFMIFPMFPAIMKDLHFTYQNLGEIAGVLSIAWGIAALFAGRLSDLFGRRRVVLITVTVFSVLVGISGLATSLITMLLLRAVMGFADGAYTAPSIAATMEASKPSRQGQNIGIEQMMLPLFGQALAPLLVTNLLHVMDWRWIFVLVTPFGFTVAYMLFRVLKSPAELAHVEHTVVHDPSAHKWTDVFQYRNIILNIMAMIVLLTCQITLGAMLPSYLVDYLHLSVPSMGFVLSSIGFGGAAGALVLAPLSDRLGRKPVMLISSLCAALSLYLFIQTGASPDLLFGLMFVMQFFTYSLVALTVGPISAESVPPALMATAPGVVVCIGEIFGGGGVPIIGGFVAQHYGIQYIPYLALAGVLAAFSNSLFLRETAPARLKDTTREAGVSVPQPQAPEI